MDVLELRVRKNPHDNLFRPTTDGQLSTEDRLKASISVDLLNLDWSIVYNSGKVTFVPPENYDKTTIRKSMAVKRQEIINRDKMWIERHLDQARENLADGVDVFESTVEPLIEECRSERQHNLFRIYRYYWSSPYSEYVGRRIRLLIRDAGVPHCPIMGIAALGSPIMHIPERDDFIGWDKATRDKNLIYATDAYVIGALPPYNHLCGGKLIAYILASNAVRDIYRMKYSGVTTLINKREASDLAAIFTSSLYGKSSQYNRIKYESKLLYQPIGVTKGYGTYHLSVQTMELIKEFIREKNIRVNNRFGDGPSWKIRLIRTAGELLGFDTDALLRHSFQRQLYYVALAENSLEFLRGADATPAYYNWPLSELVNFWRKRWLSHRKGNPEIETRVRDFQKSSFNIV